MAKYDSQLIELKNVLPAAKSILIALSANANIDQLAAGLALFLSLEASGKQVSIVCDDTINVGQAHLFGIDHVQKNLPSVQGGNLTLTLEGVAASDNTIPALEKLDWYAEGSNLNLVFHVLPGQVFQPGRIVPRYQGSGFDLIFVIGAVNLNALGNVYQANNQSFSGTHIVNIDTQSSNTSFGQTNVLDTTASSLSEVMTEVITELRFSLDSDSASNLLAGIFDATGNLTGSQVSAETYMAVAQCLRSGGKKPGSKAAASPYNWAAVMPASPAFGVASRGEPTDQPAADSQSIIDQGDHSTSRQQPGNQPSPPIQSVPIKSGSGSPEERPVQEGVTSENIEPEWLTPKIFKGSSLG